MRVRDDRLLEASFRLGISIVPTLIRFADGVETGTGHRLVEAGMVPVLPLSTISVPVCRMNDRDAGP